MTLYDVDDENRQHIERHSQQIEEGEANRKTSPFNFFPSYRRVAQLPGRLFSPSDICKKMSHHFLLHFPIGMGSYDHHAKYQGVFP